MLQWYNPNQTLGSLRFVSPALLCGVSSPFLSPGLKWSPTKSERGQWGKVALGLFDSVVLDYFLELGI